MGVSSDEEDLARENWAIALVHGVGAFESREMIQQVTAALREQRPTLQFDDHFEVHDFATNSGGASDQTASQRIQYICRGKLGRSSVRMATAYWGDVSFHRRGFLNLVGAFLLTSFGVRYLIDPGRLQKGMLAWAYYVVLRPFMFILALGVFPLTMYTLILSSTVLVWSYLFDDLHPNMEGWVVAGASLAVCLGLSAIGLARIERFGRSKSNPKLEREEEEETPPIWKERRLAAPVFYALAIVGLASSVTLISSLHLNDDWSWSSSAIPKGPITEIIRAVLTEFGERFDPTYADRVHWLKAVGVHIALLGFLQIVVGFVLIVLTSIVLVILAITYLNPTIGWGDKRSYLAAPIAVMSLWSVMLAVFWPENLLTHWAMNARSATVQTVRLGSVVTAGGATVRPDERLTAPLNVLRIQRDEGRLKLKIGPRDQPETAPDQQPDKSKAKVEPRAFSDFPMLWFDLVFLAFMGLLVVVVGLNLGLRKLWLARMRSQRLADFCPEPGAMKPRKQFRPRLILPTMALFVIVGLMVAITIVTALHLFAVLSPVGSGAFVLAASEWGRVSVSPGALGFFIAVEEKWVTFGVFAFLGLMLMLSHVIGDGAKLVLDVVNHFTSPSSAEPFPVRKRIERKLEKAIDFLLSEGDRPHLVVMAHSQGTITALDHLLGRAWNGGAWQAKWRKRARSLTIVTFGSPLTHIYQHYFSCAYPSLDTPALQQLVVDGNVRWLNVYRIDDYVGTHIRSPIPSFPVNVPATSGGHVSYWASKVGGENAGEAKEPFARLFAEPAMRDVLPVGPRLLLEPAET